MQTASMTKLDISIDFPKIEMHNPTQLELSVYNQIEAAIFHQLESFPDKPLDLREIALSTCTDGPSVKTVCYFLTVTRQIKASFFPMHKWCHKRIGDNGTAYALEDAIDAGTFDGECEHCGGIMNGKNSIAVGMEFWKLGSQIK